MTHQTRIGSQATPAITYFQLFRYSTLTDRLLILMGCIVSMAAGVAIPLLNINFGHMIDIYIQFDELSDFHHDLLRRPRNYTTFQVGFEGMLVEKEVDGMREIPIEVREFSEKSYMIAFNILAIGFVYFLLCYFFTVIMDKAASTIMYRTRLKFYESLLKHEVTWYDESFVLQYSSDMETKFQLMEDGIGKKTGFFLYMLSTSICSLLTAVYYGWELTFVLIALTPAFAILFALVCRNQRSREEQALHDRQLVNYVAREIISMIRVILSYGGEVKQIIRFERVIHKSVKSEMAFKVLASIGYGLVWFSNYLTYAVGVWYGSKLIIVSRETGSHDYTVGRIIIVFWNVLSITYFAGRTESFLALFESAATAAGEIFHLIQRESCSHAAGIRPNQFAATVRFENVSLNHTMQTESESSHSSSGNGRQNNSRVSNSWSRTSRKCLKDFSMRLKEGETIAVIGKAGSGKSLIPKLLTRIIEQQEGRISVGDMEIENLNLEWLRSNIGYVGMEPFIFDGTIYDNIWLGDRTSIKSDIVEAAKLANASAMIHGLSPAGLDTVVGSKGRILSPGEKQRIAIAKALLKKPKILLLDQVTRNVPQHEMRDLTLAIEMARLRRTTILVSDHVTPSVRNADHILVIQNGRVVEEGTHDDLIRQKGAYKEIWVHEAVCQRMSRSIRSHDGHEGEKEDKVHHEQKEGKQEVIPFIDDGVETTTTRQSTAGYESCVNETTNEGRERDASRNAAAVADGNSGNEDAGDGKRKDRNEDNEAGVREKEEEEDGKECSPKLMSRGEMRHEREESGEEVDIVVVGRSSDGIVTEEDGVKLSVAKLDSSSMSMTSDSSSITTTTATSSTGKHRKRSGSCFTAFSHQYSVQRIAKFMEKDFAFMLMGGICSAIFGLGVPLYAIVVGEFMLVLESKDHEQILRETKLIAAAFFALAILVSVASTASSIFLAMAASRLGQRLKSQAIRSLLTQNLDRVAGVDGQTGRERLEEILCNDVEPLCDMVTQRTASYSQAAGTFFACAIYSLSLNWQMGLIAISIMPFIMYRFKILSGSSSSSANAAREVDKSQLQEQTHEMTKTSKKLIHAVRSSSCLQHQIQFTTIFKKILMQDLQRKDGLLHMKGQALAVIQCIPVLAYGIVFMFGSHYIQEDTIHYSDFFKIVEGVIFGSILVSEGALFSADVRDLKGRAGYLFHLIDAKKLADSSGFGSIPDGSDGTIQFSHVDYRSKRSPCQLMLKSVSLSVARGSSVALVGQDGAAGQALTCLAQKLLQPDAGAVLLDGHDISSLNTPWIRSKIAVITSDPQLFSISLGENIAFGDNNRYVSFAEVVEAAKAAGIHDFIHSLAQGYDTLTDSRLHLNQEQKLRLSIARALVRNPALVILEQIDSGLDEGGMNQLQSALTVLKKGRSVICLPSDLSRNSEYDRVVLIQNATVQVEGSHEDLMRHSGYYFDLYKLYE